VLIGEESGDMTIRAYVAVIGSNSTSTTLICTAPRTDEDDLITATNSECAAREVELHTTMRMCVGGYYDTFVKLQLECKSVRL
jgi:hypothetical protein